MRIAVIALGSWGTAIANLLSENGHEVWAQGRDAAFVRELTALQENKKYLPGVRLSDRLNFTVSAPEAVRGADMVVSAVPTQGFRSSFESYIDYMSDGAVLVNLAKGIEIGTSRRLSQVAGEICAAAGCMMDARNAGGSTGGEPEYSGCSTLGCGEGAGCAPEALSDSGLCCVDAELERNGNKCRNIHYVALSGPTHAEEVALRHPSAIVAASSDEAVAMRVQEAFASEYFRVYRSSDLVGVELAGALKNVIAVAAGIVDGIGYGDNAKAALITRGLAEITRFGCAHGAQRETFSGLAGVGDMIVTCGSAHSRNLRFGRLVGAGIAPSQAERDIGMVVEGVHTLRAVTEKLSALSSIEMPITEMLGRVLRGEIEVKEALITLMTRSYKSEE